MKRFFGRFSLSHQFLMVSFPILLAATLVIGFWLGQQVENGVVRKIGGVTALYVGHGRSGMLPELTDLSRGPSNCGLSRSTSVMSYDVVFRTGKLRARRHVPPGDDRNLAHAAIRAGWRRA